MSAHPPLGASVAPPKNRRLCSSISVDVDVNIDDFDDDVILQAADDIRNGAVPAVPEDAVEIAKRAYLAICYRDADEERRLARELIGTLIGRIL